jgi:hypothetical protein
MAYIYRHIRLDKNEPFYIGIGSDSDFKRALSSKDRNTHWYNIKTKSNYKIDILLKNLTWEEACNKEKEFIKLYGRSDLKKGTLCNLTDGGEGFVGLIFSDEHKKNISKNNAKIWLGKKRPELAALTIKMNKERVFTEETRKKMSIAKKGEKAPMYNKFGKDHHTSKSIICVNTGIKYESIRSASQILELNHGHIASVVRGILKATGHKKYPGGLTFKQLIN